MSLHIVRKPNEHFRPGTHVELTDDGFQQVTLRETPNGWVIDKRVGIIIPWTKDLAECMLDLHSRTLPPDILAKIREDWNK